MARYIDADKVHEGVEALQISLESNNDAIWEKNKPYYKGLAMARAVINETPTADVAPRAEVAREIFEETMRAMESGIAEADKAVINNISVLDFRESLCRAGEMYAGYIGMAICKVFQKYAEDGK